jgi:DNA-binding CsgD family transcriptional regulator
MLAAARGDSMRLEAIAEGPLRGAVARGEGSALGGYAWFTALLHNGHGHYGEALEAAQRACEHEDPIYYGCALAELIEAAVRSNRSDEAAVALESLSERTQASGTEWALGVEARCRALISDDESPYAESVERLARSRAAVELARSRLLYGEWLRRENRRVDAREQLRAAHEMFDRMGAEAFAERARRELSATGETVRKRSVETIDELTTQEAQVARLAADGHTNPEIGAQLFISPRTVEYHLRKVFTKLGISSRKELRRALPAPEHAAVPA